MGIPKEPRQQMINMMYLVLTALLALNVSAEILNAFYLVRDSIMASTRALEGKNVWTYQMLQTQLEVDEKRVRPLYEKALEVRNRVNEFIQYVNTLKRELIEASGGYKGEDTTRFVGEKNLDVPSNIMLVKGKGLELQQKINDLRAFLLKVVEEVSPEEVERMAQRITLRAEDPANDPMGRNWAEFNFQMVPTVAAITLLDKFINDARAAEAEIVNFLLNAIGAEQFRFDVLIARVVPNSNFILLGDYFQAEIFVAATSSTQNPEIYIGKLKEEVLQVDTVSGRFREVTENPLAEVYRKVPVMGGIGVFRDTPRTQGVREYEGAIRVVKPTGEEVWFPFRFSYIVSGRIAVVSPTKMNVFYIGVANPVEISVPGFAPEDVIVSISQGSIRKRGPGKYDVYVKKPGKAYVTVSVRTPEGRTMVVGRKEFRVKRIPDPVPKVGNLRPGKVKASQFKAQRGIIAVPEGFEFDVKFEVLGFEMVYRPKRGEAIKVTGKGPLFNARMRQLIGKAKPGDVISFYDIRVKAPDGTTRTLPSITYQLI